MQLLENLTWGAFDVPESKTWFQIMILKIINMILPLYKHYMFQFYDSGDVLDSFWNLNGVWFTCFGIIFLIFSNKMV